MKKYELVYIVHPDLEDTIDKIAEKISGFIKKKGGNIVSEDSWGKRKLAYPIKKNEFGLYIVLTFDIEPKEIQGIEKFILLSEEIIRHLVVLEEEGIEKKRTDAAERKAKAAERKEKEAKTEKPKKTAKGKEEKADIELEVKEEKKEKKKVKVKEEKERLKELDEKLGKLLGDDKE